MEFKQFADLVNTKFSQLSEADDLFIVNVSKESLWTTYQTAYPAADNPIFRERRVHECNTCYSFIKRLGPVVAITDSGLDTIWDVPDLPEPYATVAATMHQLVSSSTISSVFRTDEQLIGKEFNIEENTSGDIRWNHFYANISAMKFRDANFATTIGDVSATVSVFKRALEEFSESSLTTTIYLCQSIYRGEEFLPTVEKFLLAKIAYNGTLNKTNFLWANYSKYPAKIRNSAIGTLIKDIEAGTELEQAVKSFENVVAPSNYKRTSAVITPGMKKQAVTTIDELGLRDSLPRRHATLTDININDVLFADRSAAELMQDDLDILLSSLGPQKAPKGSTEVSIDSFISDVLPHSTSIEALVENYHTSNFVSLVAPVHADAPNMLKWDNNFSWSYNGEMTDSMKERVKLAGGAIDGVLRFSIQWNEENMDKTNDLDAHCYTPDSHIYYGNKKDHWTGELDVDITEPGSTTAVENITWQNLSKMPNGDYRFYVGNFLGRNTKGFRAEIEFNGEVFEYDYPISVTSDVSVATVKSHNGKFTIAHHMKPSSVSKSIYSVDTLEYQKVSSIMLSPNFWDDKSIGNKHFFFMLDGCKNPDSVRGFYNEFLMQDLYPHRKTFEVLSAKMRCEPSDDQLSGLGFSSTQRNKLSVRVDGRPYTINF